MAVSRLTDGLPITTEWLNSLVDEINNLKGGTGTTASGNVVEFVGTFFSSTTRPIQVVADRITGVAAGGELTFETSVVFPNSFGDSNVIVVATPSFISTTDRLGKPVKASASVGQIASTGFLLTVSFVEDSNTYTAGKQVTVDYVAIGKKL
jgi:hypothetical protein